MEPQLKRLDGVRSEKKYYYINKNGQAELKTPDYYKIGKKYYYIDVNGNRIKKKGWMDLFRSLY